MSRKPPKVVHSAIASRVEVSPDPGGNRAQRRAWAKLTKKKAERGDRG